MVQGEGQLAVQRGNGRVTIDHQRAGAPVSAGRINKLVDAVNNLTQPIGGHKQVVSKKSSVIDRPHDTLTFRQELSELPAKDSYWAPFTVVETPVIIEAVRADRSDTGTTDADYQFEVTIDEVADSKLTTLNLGTNKYFETGVSVAAGEKINIKTITAEPVGSVTGVEIRLMLSYDGVRDPNVKKRFGGTEEPDP